MNDAIFVECHAVLKLYRFLALVPPEFLLDSIIWLEFQALQGPLPIIYQTFYIVAFELHGEKVFDSKQALICAARVHILFDHPQHLAALQHTIFFGFSFCVIGDFAP